MPSATPQSGLFIRTLGSPSISWNGKPVFQGKKKATALVIYLALQPEKRALREHLAELLWANSSAARARSSLRQCLAEIRRETPALLQATLQINATELCIESQTPCIDIDQLFSQNLQENTTAFLESSAEFSDQFLASLSNISQDFDVWIRECHQSTESRLVSGLFDIMHAPGTRAAEALRAARAISRLDPYNEEACRFAMRDLAMRGETGASLQMYAQLYARLDEALGMEPSAETQDLAVAIKTGQLDQHSDPISRDNDQQAKVAPHPANAAGPRQYNSPPSAGAASQLTQAFPQAPVGPPKLAIFPFVDLGPVPVESYFLNGILEDTVSLLAQLRELQVYSSNTTRQFQGLVLEPNAQPGGLDADYCVTGSVRGTGDRFRVTVQLVDSRSGLIEWANTYAAHASELFDMQTDIAMNLTHQLLPSVSSAELRRTQGTLPADLSAYHLMIRGRDIAFRLDQASFAEAKILLEQACERDPRYGMSRLALTDWHSVLLGQGWSRDAKADGEALQAAAQDAVHLSGDSGRALARYAHSQTMHLGFNEQALEICTKALNSAPQDAETLLWSAPTLSFAGQAQVGIKNAEAAIRLSPCDPYLFRSEHFLSIAHFAAGNYAKAVAAGQRARRLNPNYTSNLRMTAVALAELGEISQATNIAMEIKRLDPSFRISRFLSKQPFFNADTGQRYADRLREVGLPD